MDSRRGPAPVSVAESRLAARQSGVCADVGRSVPVRRVFRGDLLPKELNRLFEGVHFNAGFSSKHFDLPEDFNAEALAYMATAADYVWNPQGWKADESARRAQRFVAIMRPLVGALASPPAGAASGGSTISILTPAKPSLTEKHAAEELAHYLHKACGTTFAIVSEPQPAETPCIAIGRTNRLRRRG